MHRTVSPRKRYGKRQSTGRSKTITKDDGKISPKNQMKRSEYDVSDEDDDDDVEEYDDDKENADESDDHHDGNVEEEEEPKPRPNIDYEEKEQRENSAAADSSSSSPCSDEDVYHWITPRPKIKRKKFVSKLEYIKKDDDQTKQLLQRYISWMVLLAGGKSLKREQFIDIYKAKSELEGRLKVAMRVCQSQAWCPEFRGDIRKYPEWNSVGRGGNGKCQVCVQPDRYSSFNVTLRGTAYNIQTFENIKTSCEEKIYSAGKMCNQRAELFHKLYHFGYHLYHACKAMIDNGKDRYKDRESLLEENYLQLTSWFNEVYDDYTNAAGAGVNKKWLKEFKY